MLLRDDDIDALLRAHPDAVDPLPQPLGGAPNPSLLIQPSSLDLCVGGIYRPNAEPGKDGSIGHPLQNFDLPPGHTAVIETKESLHLPEDYCAIAFPPAHVSSKGILTTNPGHVDPGYTGTLSFTVINMGRYPFPLTQGSRIVTLLLFQLSAAPHYPYNELVKPDPGSKVMWDTVRSLSEDFVNVDQRAKKIARKQAAKVLVGGTIGAIVASFLTAFLTIFIYMTTTNSSLNDKINQLQREVAVIQATQNK